MLYEVITNPPTVTIIQSDSQKCISIVPADAIQTDASKQALVFQGADHEVEIVKSYNFV